MSCQAKAAWPACTNSGGTARRASKACRNAARSSSSPQPWDNSVRRSSSPPLFLIALTSCLVYSCLPGSAAQEGADVGGAPKAIEATGTHRADGSHRYGQCRADVLVAAWRVTEKHGQQFAAAWWKLGECSAERSVAFRTENLVVDDDGIGIHRHLVLGRQPRVRMPVR